MRRILLALMLVSLAVPASAQFEPQNFLLNCPASATPPTHIEGQIHLCSQTLGGRVRVDATGTVTVEPGTNPVEVTLVDTGGTPLTQGFEGTHDTALGTITNVSGPMDVGRASAAAPADVSADGDAVLAWRLRNGAGVTALQSAGVLIAGDSSGLEIQGGVAHAATDAGNPANFGATGETALSGITLVTDGQRTRLYAGIDGVLIMRPYANLEDRVSAAVGVTDGSSTSLVAAQGAGVRFCATTIIVSNSSATNVTLDLRDGTAGAVLATIPAAANMGGAVIPFPVPLCTTANTILAADPSAAATTVTTTAIGFKTKL